MKVYASLTAALAFAAAPALAHEGGHAPRPRPPVQRPPLPVAVTEDVATQRAQAEVDRLVTEKKVEASWQSERKFKSLEKKTRGASFEWRVTFENPAAAKKKVLYVFLTADGTFVAANHSGK